MTRACIIRPRRGEIGPSQEKRRSLAFLGAKNGWMDGGLLNYPGGLRNANFGCQVGTSRGIGRGKVREQDKVE